jgi:hypothetical protein
MKNTPIIFIFFINFSLIILNLIVTLKIPYLFINQIYWFITFTWIIINIIIIIALTIKTTNRFKK